MLNFLIILILSFQNAILETIPTPDVEKDLDWNPYVFEKGTHGKILPNDIVAFYQKNYPDYYASNKELMSLLKEQYNNRILWHKGEGKNSFYDFSNKKPSSLVIKNINEIITRKHGNVSFSIEGLREIDKTDKYLFNRIYKWYNFGYSDGYYLDIWSDDDLFRKLKLDIEKVRSASFIVECFIEIEENVSEEELFYFDDNETFLFSIIYR